MSLVWNVLDVNEHVSNKSHKAEGLGRNPCRNKKGSLSLGSYQAAENSVFSVPREVRSNICYPIRASIQLL